ncbi:unnamed protein product [Rotaria sp. Silwood2]|nr:unnamed protein product [Rotaria sp. Silwood2]CAF4038315.1 unnamed protein product [Rotaria sp. Silwood2]
MFQPQDTARPTEETLSPNHQLHQDTTKTTEGLESPLHEQLFQSTTTHRSISQEHQETDENAALRAQIRNYREQNVELIQSFQNLNEELKRKKIDSFEVLTEQDKEMKKIFIELARLTQPMPMEGCNIGLFGLTSTGKSTMLNAIIGQKLAETGVGETTRNIVSYQSPNFTLWDVPGRNDEMTYMTMEYISFFKGLSKRLILIEATVKENSSMMKLFDELELRYAIVFNKFDKVDDDEQQQIQQQIGHEIKILDNHILEIIWNQPILNQKNSNIHRCLYLSVSLQTYPTSKNVSCARYHDCRFIYWNRNDIQQVTRHVQFNNYLNYDQDFYTALNYLTDYGLVIGEIPHTFYGKPWDVRSVQKAIHIIYTSQELESHMNLLYFKAASGLQFLHS